MFRIMNNSLTTSQLSGDLIKTIDAPEIDAIYMLRSRPGERGAVILFCSVAYSSYMPTVQEAELWVESDRERMKGTERADG